MPVYRCIGLMSGSSLDGLDIAYVRFTEIAGQWSCETISAECLEYPPALVSKLKQCSRISGRELWLMHTQLGHFFGNAVNNFLSLHKLEKPDYVSSHGHTIFHDPENMMSCQIGDGAALAQACGITTICDLRSSDIACGGQGAPIVPIGDRLLYSAYDCLLNIGGIANITLRNEGNKMIAYDICAANQVLNYYANQAGRDYDEDGKMASRGNSHEPLLSALQSLPYYLREAPKSLDNGFSISEVLPLIDRYNISLEDKLATYTEHMAIQIAQAAKGREMLVTGGGAFNKFLIERTGTKTRTKLVVPDDITIKFKEAIVMALIGVLRIREEVNVLSGVTGARKSSIGGAVYLPS